MKITEHNDERGAFLRVEFPDGKAFFVDSEDRALVEAHRWRVYLVNGRQEYVLAGIVGVGTKGLHRLIMGDPPHCQVDHEDGNRMNCRRYNLRHATKAQNGANRRSIKYRTANGYRGAYEQKNGRFVATVSIGGKLKYLGTFDTAIEAAKARDAAMFAAFGEFAVLNFPEDYP